ncbi:hypothetical protein JXA88_08420 [Candidatus Fermentibacteria bacterium]|nr:hypothetical protein [Candidatus Fermentibacteria bacterium]
MMAGRYTLWPMILAIGFFWLCNSAFFNFHYHVDPFGRMVVHTHPFDSSDEGAPTHSHTDHQYLTLSGFIAKFFLFALVAAWVLYPLNQASRLLLPAAPARVLVRHELSPIFVRAPPLLTSR